MDRYHNIVLSYCIIMLSQFNKILSDASLVNLWPTGIKTDRDRIPMIDHVLSV